MHVYLAKLITSIDYDTAINNEVPSTTMELQKILDCDGHVLVKEEVMIAEANLLREDWFQERATNDKCYETLEPSDPWKGEDCCSNESPCFKDWVFVLLLASQRLRFLAENTSPRDLSKWIVRLSN